MYVQQVVITVSAPPSSFVLFCYSDCAQTQRDTLADTLALHNGDEFINTISPGENNK